jgi:hypothetical protein
MKIIKPKTITEVRKYFNNLKYPLATVLLYHTIKQGKSGLHTTVFVLNPFGGGTTDTQEISLPMDWKLTKKALQDIIIITN